MCADNKWRKLYTLRLKALKEILLKKHYGINYCEPKQGIRLMIF